jgi:diadenylate cyclase
MLNFLKNITAIDIIDIIIVSLLLYILFLWLKKTQSVFVFMGIIISSIIYMFVKLLRLRLVATLMQGFFAVILIAIVIIFQEDIRRLFEKIALWSLRPTFRKRKKADRTREQISNLVNTVFDLAHGKIGTLIILKAQDVIIRHIHGGIELDGILSAPLLKSIFDTHSEGHDGGVIIEQGKVSRFACHLPLSKNIDLLKNKGTRHAAALGLSELTDALCIVVSETTGDVTVARFGQMHRIEDPETLTALLKDFQEEINPAPETGGVKRFFFKNIRMKLTAVLASLLLWFVFVHGSEIVYKTFYVPVRYVGLSGNLQVNEVDPQTVQVVLSAPRRDFYFTNKDDVSLEIKLFNLQDLKHLDRDNYEITLTASDVAMPSGHTIVNIFPRYVRFSIAEKNPPNTNINQQKLE